MTILTISFTLVVVEKLDGMREYIHTYIYIYLFNIAATISIDTNFQLKFREG